MTSFLLALILSLSPNASAATPAIDHWSLQQIDQIYRDCIDPIYRNPLEQLYGQKLDKNRWSFEPDLGGWIPPALEDFEHNPEARYYFSGNTSTFGLDSESPLFNTCNAKLIHGQYFSVQGASAPGGTCSLWRPDLKDIINFRGFTVAYISVKPFFYDVKRDALGNVISYSYAFTDPKVELPEGWKPSVRLTSLAGVKTNIVIDLAKQRRCMERKLASSMR